MPPCAASRYQRAIPRNLRVLQSESESTSRRTSVNEYVGVLVGKAVSRPSSLCRSATPAPKRGALGHLAECWRPWRLPDLSDRLGPQTRTVHVAPREAGPQPGARVHRASKPSSEHRSRRRYRQVPSTHTSFAKNGHRRSRRTRQAPPRVPRPHHHRRAQDWPALPRQARRRCRSARPHSRIAHPTDPRAVPVQPRTTSTSP